MQATNARCFSRCRATEEHQKRRVVPGIEEYV
jgi:hypothetical protein